MVAVVGMACPGPEFSKVGNYVHAHFHSDSVLYPDSSFHSDSGLSQGGTDSGLHPHSCLHPDSGF